MPISFRYASAPKASNVACWAFQPNRPDTTLARASIRHDGCPPGHAVPATALQGLQHHQGVVVDRLDETRAEEGERHPPYDHVRVAWDRGLACVTGDREQVEERFPARIEGGKRTVWHLAACPDLSDGTDAADRRHVVTRGTARAVEGRAQPLLGGFNLQEVVQAQTEFFELGRREAWQWVARLHRPSLPKHERRDDPHQRGAGCGATPHHAGAHWPSFGSSAAMMTPRMNEWPAPHSFEHSNV